MKRCTAQFAILFVIAGTSAIEAKEKTGGPTICDPAGGLQGNLQFTLPRGWYEAVDERLRDGTARYFSNEHEGAFIQIFQPWRDKKGEIKVQSSKDRSSARWVLAKMMADYLNYPDVIAVKPPPAGHDLGEVSPFSPVHRELLAFRAEVNYQRRSVYGRVLDEQIECYAIEFDGMYQAFCMRYTPGPQGPATSALMQTFVRSIEPIHRI